MTRLTGYRLFIILVLLLWPFVIAGVLYLMSRLERYVSREGATTPEEAGLEPVTGRAPEKEVRIVFGDRVVGEPEPERQR